MAETITCDLLQVCNVALVDDANLSLSGAYVAEQPICTTVEEQARLWKYSVPDVSTLYICKLNQSELIFLERHLPVDSDLWTEVARFNLINEEERWTIQRKKLNNVYITK